MKSILFTFSGLLLFCLACTPDPLPDLKLANLIGNWEASSSYRYQTEDGLGDKWGRKEFRMGIQEDRRLWFLDATTADTAWGEWQEISPPNDFAFALKRPALDSLFPETVYEVYMRENRRDALSLSSNYFSIINGRRIWIDQEIELKRMP